MIVRTLIDGLTHTFNSEDKRHVIGEGGEAFVARWTPPRSFTNRYGDRKYAVKLYFEDTLQQKAAAVMRQQKLRNLPHGLPQNAVMPTCYAFDTAGRIIGYVMPLIEDVVPEGVVPLVELMDAQSRKKHGITPMRAVRVLMNLHALVTAVHKAGVVIGDFNDKNVLIKLRTCEVYLVDLDSAQWGSWPSGVATAEFTDPTLLDSQMNLRRGASYSQASDWYAFTVMVYQLLTLSHPYKDGVHHPIQQRGHPIAPRVRFPDRVTVRLSVFDRTVRLDVDAGLHHPASLPEELGAFMRDVFTRDRRATPFPLHLLTSFQWMTCPRCRREHGRITCPNRKCGAAGISRPQAAPRTSPAPASATPTQAQSTTYVAAKFQNGQLRYAHHQGGAYRREDDAVVLNTALNPDLSVMLAGNRTVLCAGTDFAVVNGDPRQARRLSTYRQYGKTTAAANSSHVYWVDGSSLVRDQGNGTVTIGSVIPGLTSVWAGERFGVAMVQAGVLTRILTFDTTRQGFQGEYLLPPNLETVVDAHCAVSDTHAWVMVATRAADGKVTNRCYVFDAKARLLAATAAYAGDGSWLGTISTTALAVQDRLFVPVARTGIVRVVASGSTPQVEGTYRNVAGVIPDAKATVGLCFTPTGLMHVGRTAITKVASTP